MSDLEKYRNVPFSRRTACLVCDTVPDSPLIELPEFPLTEFFIDNAPAERLGFADQEFHLCKVCGHGQIANVVDPSLLYGDTYVTRTSTSPSAMAAIDEFIVFIDKVAGKREFECAVEIGCNDLYTLRKLKARARRLYGIDPIFRTRSPEETDEKIEVIGDFVENVDLGGLEGRIDLVLSSHTLEHLDDPRRLIERLLQHSHPETLLFFQFPGLESLVFESRFDRIFHQHLNYFSLESIAYLVRSLGGDLIDYRVNADHWGTLMVAFRPGGTQKTSTHPPRAITPAQITSRFSFFRDSLDLAARRLEFLRDRPVYGYGAAAMLPILDYYMKNLSLLDCVLDEDPRKAGSWYLNVPLQIRNPSEIAALKEAAVMVTAINSKQPMRAIMGKLLGMGVKEIITPLNSL